MGAHKIINPSTDVVVIRACEAQLDQIVEFETSIFKNNEPFSRRRLRYLLTSSNSAFFVILHKRVPVGYGIALRSFLRGGTVKGRIYSIGLLSKWKRKGLGRVLLSYLEKWLKEQGASYITLETRVGRGGAIKFFEAMGYSISEPLPNYYMLGDGVRMKKITFE